MSATYSSAYYEKIHAVEARHFWFSARNVLLAHIIRRFLPDYKKRTFLEIGCGTGIVLGLLQRLGLYVTGLDVNMRALGFARKKVPTVPLIRSSIYTYKSAKLYDAVGAFDVLEHQTEDIRFLTSCFRLLKPGGVVFLTVPAGMWLWQDVDALAGHKRRYERGELIKKLSVVGFDVVYANYWNVLTLPFYLLWRRRIHTETPKELVAYYLRQPPGFVNTMMYLLLLVEHVGFFRYRYPCGASLVVCAKKPI